MVSPGDARCALLPLSLSLSLALDLSVSRACFLSLSLWVAVLPPKQTLTRTVNIEVVLDKRKVFQQEGGGSGGGSSFFSVSGAVDRTLHFITAKVDGVWLAKDKPLAMSEHYDWPKSFNRVKLGMEQTYLPPAAAS